MDLGSEIAALGDLSREELAARWVKAHDQTPPKGIRHELLVRSASWHLQEHRLGGPSSTARRALKAATAKIEKTLAAKRGGGAGLDNIRAVARPSAADPIFPSDIGHATMAKSLGPRARFEAAAPASIMRRRQTLAPGARLVRDWNGKTHVVDVIEEGFVFQAKIHKSLTAVAHLITGAHWSGPRFFGL